MERIDNTLDEDGYVVDEGSLAKIPEQFSALVETVKSAVLKAFEHELHSLYLYGSVSTGTAKPKTSDLDVFLVFRGSLPPYAKATIAQLENELSQKFQSDISEVGIEAASLAEIFEGDNQIGWGFFIKHQCVCLAGEDLGDQFPRFKPTKAVAYGLNGDLKQEIEKAKEVIQTGSPEAVSKSVKSISRKMIRTAFCLVVEKAKCWTTNLSDCADIFATYYPKHTSQVDHVLQIAQGLPVNNEEFLGILNSFGSYLCSEVEDKLR